jgi:hypothetical protein
MFRDPLDGGQGLTPNANLGDQFSPDSDVRIFSLAEIERTREAGFLVVHDVSVELGDGVVELVIGTPEELSVNLASRGLGHIRASEVCGWVLCSDGGTTSIWFPEDVSWPDLVVRMADAIQEEIIEGVEHRGVAFPKCRTHPNHPMDAEVVDGVASWVCPKDSGTPIPIGELQVIVDG